MCCELVLQIRAKKSQFRFLLKLTADHHLQKNVNFYYYCSVVVILIDIKGKVRFPGQIIDVPIFVNLISGPAKGCQLIEHLNN